MKPIERLFLAVTMLAASMLIARHAYAMWFDLFWWMRRN